MKKFLIVIGILSIASCSSNSNELEGDTQAEQENVEDINDGSEDETPPGEGNVSIPYDITVFTLEEENIFERNLINGNSSGDGALVSLPEAIDFNSSVNIKTEGSKLFFWNQHVVWTYDVESRQNNTYTDFFNSGNGSEIFNRCIIPTYDEIFTFYSTNDDPSVDYYFAESYNTKTGETYTVNLPESASAVLNCLTSYKFGTSGMLLYNYYDERDLPNNWGIIDLDQKTYTNSFNSGNDPFALYENEIIFVSSISVELSRYDIKTGVLSATKDIYYQSEEYANTSSKPMLGFRNVPRIPARFESDKMIFFNGTSGEIYTSGNIAEFYGPAILDLQTGAFEVFSSLKIYHAYTAISQDRFSLKILQSDIDLESKTIILTYYDVSHTASPYGIIILDFELNVLKQYDFGDQMPIAMFKH